MRVRELGLVLALLVVCVAVTLREPRFLGAANLEQVALSATLVCIVALGEALVIITRQIDLSVGAIVAMSAFVAADWLEDHQQGSMVIVFLIGLARRRRARPVQRLPGRRRAHPGDRRDARHARGLPGRRDRARGGPPDLGDRAARRLSGDRPDRPRWACRLLVWLAVALTILFGWVARYTRTGRNLYALGSSPESARLLGINETGHIAFVFILSGLLCGLVGVLWGARFGTVDAVLAPDLHLQAISAVVIGGVSIFGGSGSVYGAAIGAVIFAVLQNGVQLLGINQFWLEAVIGAAILGTVMFYSLLARGAERAERRSRHAAGR